MMTKSGPNCNIFFIKKSPFGDHTKRLLHDVSLQQNSLLFSLSLCNCKGILFPEYPDYTVAAGVTPAPVPKDSWSLPPMLNHTKPRKNNLRILDPFFNVKIECSTLFTFYFPWVTSLLFCAITFPHLLFIFQKINAFFASNML